MPFFRAWPSILFQGVTGECSMNSKEYHIQGIASEVARGEWSYAHGAYDYSRHVTSEAIPWMLWAPCNILYHSYSILLSPLASRRALWPLKGPSWTPLFWFISPLLIVEMIERHALKNDPQNPIFVKFFGQTPMISPAMPIHLLVANGKSNNESI